MVGIITNTSALNAQSNLTRASTESASSISRLSSGSRIARASDDVAGLAVGTILQTNVSTLKAALSNTAQANSLLGVADGALKNIGDLLQRQKALAAQATSGSLTDQARSFLNQEFQNLKSEIDRISDSTNFNGIKLVDGSLYTPSKLTSETSKTAVAVSGTVTFANTMASGSTITIAVGGECATFTFATNATGSPLSIDLSGNFGFVGAGVGANDATNFMTAIERVVNSTDTTAAVVQAKRVLSGISFVRNNGAITMTSKASGTDFNAGGGRIISVTGNITGNNTGDFLLVNGTNAGGAAVNLSAGGTAATGNSATATPPIYGYLSAGNLSTTSNAYAGTATTIAVGTITDNILTALDVGNTTTTGANFSGLSNNKDFIGNIDGFKATFNQAGYVDLTVKVGDYSYLAKNVATAPGTDTIVRFASVEAGGGFFDLQFNDSTTSGQTAVTNQADADNFANRINKALSGVTAYQQRSIDSFQGVGSIYNSGGTAIGNLTGANLYMFHDSFQNLKVEDIKVTAGNVTGNVQPVIEMTINGEIYRSGYDETGASSSSFAVNGTAMELGANNYMGLRNVNDPNKLVVFQNSSTALDFTNVDNASSVEAALKEALNVGKGGSNLSFQVGTTAADNIFVQVQSAKTKDIYLNDNGATQTLDISTLAGANAASPVLDNAINTVTAIRANIGALQSRFDYAAANINSGIQNQDAARSTYLDTDIASESTMFAQSQVRVQASISVLAQANQLPQNLLKLIG